MLTAHTLSFPTCLFHPRSIHLLCHLDSPSAANLPCLGLQQQTGPEVSELCGSYRVPSMSSLLPLCTLSPGENRLQDNNLFFQPQSPLSPGESVVQLTNKTHAVQHCVAITTNGENKHRLSNWFNNDKMVSRLWFGNRDSTHRLILFRKRVSWPSRINTGYPQNQHRLFPPWFQNCTRSPTEVGSDVQFRRSGRMEENPSHSSSWPFYSHAPGLTLVTFGTTCVPSIWKSHVIPKELRVKTYYSHVFWNNIKILFPRLKRPRLNT
jgi:hypothetical protein